MFLPAVPPGGQRHQQRGLGTIPHLLEEVSTLTLLRTQTLSTHSEKTTPAPSHAVCVCLFVRSRSSSAEASVVQTSVLLPHVLVETIPLYVHAG